MSGTYYSSLPPAVSVQPSDTTLLSTPEDLSAPFKVATPGALAGAAFSRVLDVTAAGTTQLNATALTARLNVVTTVPAGGGVVLTESGPDGVQMVINVSAAQLLIYPPIGGQINQWGENAGVVVAAGAAATFVEGNAGQWWAV